MDLSTTIGELKLKNPLMPASGPLVSDDNKINILASFGLGAMVTKTIGIKGAMVPKPCIYGGNNKVLNLNLWSEYPHEKWTENFLPNIKSFLKEPLIISIGYNKEDIIVLISKLDKYADGFEISLDHNIDLKKVGDIVKLARKSTTKPIFIKINNYIRNLLEFVKIIKINGANGIVAVHSLGPAMVIDLNERAVKFGNEKGESYVSGPIVKPFALATINLIRENFKDFTIIGSGGVSSAEDVIEFLLCGADAVQMSSSAMIHGREIYKEILKELPTTLEKYGFSSIEEVKNTRLKKGVKFASSYPMVNNNKCISCKICEKVCPCFAITINKYPIFNKSLCFSCGLCESRCPQKAITGVI
ncbi:4Fe-4S binding protein [Clostridium senegalense]